MPKKAFALRKNVENVDKVLCLGGIYFELL